MTKPSTDPPGLDAGIGCLSVILILAIALLIWLGIGMPDLIEPFLKGETSADELPESR